MIYVDTSAFYAYLSRDDQDHHEVVATFETCLESGDQLATTSYVVAETMGLLQHRISVAAVGRFVDEILPLVQIRWIGGDEHAAAWQLLREVGKRSFTIVDASTAVLLQRDGSKRVLALDPEFRRLGFETLPSLGGSTPGKTRHRRSS